MWLRKYDEFEVGRTLLRTMTGEGEVKVISHFTVRVLTY